VSAATDRLDFLCLDPRKAKRSAIERTLSPVGPMRWVKLPPLRLSGYAETRVRAAAAFDTATKKPTLGLLQSAKRLLLRLQYNGSRSLFEANPGAVAVAWNGLNGSRRVFMDAARDAGARTLFFELCPFPGRITVDPCGVNFCNGLPRDLAPYLVWAETHGNEGWREMREAIRARTPTSPRAESTPDRPLTEPFVFVPLQVPGDSQLRIFGGRFRTVEAVIEAVSEAARRLPEGWHARLKEHPSSPVRFGDLIARLSHPKLVLDNVTDTFAQVAAARAVVTVNSSVGLEAMFFEKPVVAIGECFWAIPGIASHCPTPTALAEGLANPEAFTFDPSARAAFLSFLAGSYYPRLPNDSALRPEEAAKVRDRLKGPDSLGFWACPEVRT
jgi:capsular polysaccharide export protein